MPRLLSRITVPLAVLLLVLVPAAGCKTRDPYFCEGAPRDNCLLLDADVPCTRSSECSGDKPVCDVGGTGVCVQCTPAEADACGGTTPVCRATACEACAAHADCPASDVCLPDGACADPALDLVAYVAPGGTGTTCTRAMPCGTLDAALLTGKPTIKIAAGLVKDNKLTTISGRAVTILAEPGAKLDRDGDGAILEVRSANTDVQIYDLEITGATDPGGDGIQLQQNGGNPVLALTRVAVTGNQGRGLSASGGTLTVTQSTLSGNAGGGISVMNGTFAIVGNVFFNNGNDTLNIGGVAINSAQSTANRLEFNSFNLNKAVAGKGTAIDCFAGAFTARNNIMSENGTLANMVQVGGTCTHAYSIVRPGMVPVGTGNSGMDPLFQNTTTGDLHLKPGSPALRAADPSSNLTGLAAHDIDGDVRTSPADIGADEVP